MVGVYLNLKSETETYDVRLGPAWFLDQNEFQFAKGDHITVVGATLTTATRKPQVVIACDMQKGGLFSSSAMLAAFRSGWVAASD